MASSDHRAQLERLAPLLTREGVDVWSASASDFDAAMKRAKQRHAAAVGQVRAVLNAHARNDTSTAGALLEVLEGACDATPPPVPDALTVASRFAQVAQSVAAQLPAQVIDQTLDRARNPDALPGMDTLSTAVLVDRDAAAGLQAAVRDHGVDSALYAAASVASIAFGLWSAHTGTDMGQLVTDHA